MWDVSPQLISCTTLPAKLRERGVDAVAVAGGIGTWRADGLPTEPHNEGETR